MNILEELLTKGFFPIQLPPNFNSSSFGKNHEKINVGINRIVSADNKKKPIQRLDKNR